MGVNMEHVCVCVCVCSAALSAYVACVQDQHYKHISAVECHCQCLSASVRTAGKGLMKSRSEKHCGEPCMQTVKKVLCVSTAIAARALAKLAIMAARRRS